MVSLLIPVSGEENMFEHIFMIESFTLLLDCECAGSMVSSPIGPAEFWESEPMWTCKNINSIHDQGRRYLYLDERRSKWGFPPTQRKTTWILNFYCTAVFLKAIHQHLVSRFQNGITLDYTTSGGGRNKILSSSKPRPTSLKQTSRYLTPKCYTFLKSAGPGQFNGFK